MNAFIQSVTKFHDKIGARVAKNPRLLSCDPDEEVEAAAILRRALNEIADDGSRRSELRLRVCMALEELCEWVEAHAEGDLVAAADAWGDRFYVLLGDAVSAGLPAEDIFGEVHRSNMTKIAPSESFGKGLKESGFERPRLERCLKRESSANPKQD